MVGKVTNRSPAGTNSKLPYYTVNQLKSFPFSRSLETAILRTPNKAVAESSDQESQIIESDIPTDESQNSAVNASKASSKTSSIAVSQVSSTVSSVDVSRAESRVSSKVTSKTSSKSELEIEPIESTADIIEETNKQAIEEASEENIVEEEAVPENERPVYRSKISLKERHTSFTSYIP